MNKEQLKELCKEGKISEELIKDEAFLKEAKDILKTESPDITDDEVKNILKATEKALSQEGKLENDSDLDDVVGGGKLKGVSKKIASFAIKGIFSVGLGGVGMVAGAAGTGLGGYALAKKKGQKYFDEHENLINGIGFASSAVGGSAGAVGGYKLGSLICKKLGLK